MIDTESEAGSWARAIRDTPTLRVEEHPARPVHVMLDLETWGTTPGCDIRSIGACVFDPATGRVWQATGKPLVGSDSPRAPFYLATDNPRGFFGRYGRFISKPDGHAFKYPLTRDPSSVEWWSKQSEAAQGAFSDPVEMAEALKRFAAWITGLGDNLRLWAHGPHFDEAILAAAYRAVKMRVPWHHRAPRDTRTCFDMAYIDDHSGWLAQYPGPLGIQHHALDDAISQARAVCAAYGRSEK